MGFQKSGIQGRKTKVSNGDIYHIKTKFITRLGNSLVSPYYSSKLFILVLREIIFKGKQGVSGENRNFLTDLFF